MKRILLFAGISIMGLLFVNGCSKKNTTKIEKKKAKALLQSNLPSDALSVEKVAKNPLAFKGMIKISGVVSKVFPKRGAFILIDTDEYKGCGLDCVEQSIPVKVPAKKYKGILPKVKDIVVVTGRIKPEGKGYRFIVKDVRRGKEILIKNPDFK